MSTLAQNLANKANAQHSTGPQTEEGKANSCRNNFRHGFTGAFNILPSEERERFERLVTALEAEYRPETEMETILVERMAQHHWLVQRSLMLQEMIMLGKTSDHNPERRLALYLRYQIANDRAFHKCLDQLLKLRAEKRKEQIGFESQRRKRADQIRKDSIEKRKQELHKFAVLLAEAKFSRQVQKPVNVEFQTKTAAAPENRPLPSQKSGLNHAQKILLGQTRT